MMADRRSVLGGLTLWGLAGCSRAEGPTPPQGMDEAFAAMQALEVKAGGRIGVGIGFGDQALAWRRHDRFNYCSTFKLFLAAATLERVQRGEERLDRTVAISSPDLIAHAPVTGPAVGSHLTIQDLCRATVEVSDNPAANILIREMGGLDAWRGWLRSIGDADTTVDRLEPGLNLPDGAKDTARVDQTVTNLRAVLTQGRLDQTHGALLRRWLVDSPTGAGRIKAGAPAGWTVAHKTGTGGDGQINDIGLLEGPKGEQVFLAIYYDGPADKPAAEADAVVAEATRISLKAIGHV